MIWNGVARKNVVNKFKFHMEENAMCILIWMTIIDVQLSLNQTIKKYLKMFRMKKKISNISTSVNVQCNH